MKIINRVERVSSTVHINHAERLYVYKSGHGFSCLGFDGADNQLRGVAAWLGLAIVVPERGTPEHVKMHGEVMVKGAAHASRTNSTCPLSLTPSLIGLEGKRVDVVDSYGERRRFKVGKSTGWMPVHLELANSRSDGGFAVGGAPFQSLRVVSA